MRLTAYHDNSGNIVGLAISPADDSTPAEVMTSTRPGIRMADVEVPQGLTIDFANPARVNKALDHLLENYRVDKGVLNRKP